MTSPNTAIPDVQNSADTRQIAINKVGIKSIRHPIKVQDKSAGIQHTIAMFNMYVGLPHNFKGTHMSRFVEILNSHEREISVENFPAMLQDMVVRLEAETGHIEMNFPYFINKTAPVSGVQSLMDYDVTFIGEIANGEIVTSTKVVVPVTSLCPCSKKISERGAHNQRSHAIQAEHRQSVSLTRRANSAVPAHPRACRSGRNARCHCHRHRLPARRHSAGNTTAHAALQAASGRCNWSPPQLDSYCRPPRSPSRDAPRNTARHSGRLAEIPSCSLLITRISECEFRGSRYGRRAEISKNRPAPSHGHRVRGTPRVPACGFAFPSHRTSRRDRDNVCRHGCTWPRSHTTRSPAQS